VPAVVLGTHPFRPLARTAAAAVGLAGIPFVAVEHPIGGIEPGIARTRAESVVDLVIDALTRMPGNEAARGRDVEIVQAPDDLDRFQEFVAERRWADGLPVLPPTPERVARLLDGRDARTLVAILAPRQGEATLGAIAVNAALAGAGPEHMPVIVAALEALADPRFNLKAIQTTTHPCTPLLIVNGPIARRLGISGGANALGGGHRANAVIGRAVRLALQNVGGALPGEVDRATLGHPGKFTYCLAENEAESPWAPLHVDRGFDAGTSCVTVCGSEAPHNVNDHGSTTAEALVRALVSVAATTGHNNIYLGGEPLILLGPEHARTVAGSGWSKRDLARAVWERATLRLDRFSAENLERFAVVDPPRFAGRPGSHEVRIALAAGDVMVAVAGGPGKHSAIIPTFGATRSVTVPIAAA
jgi:hypothetical protein